MSRRKGQKSRGYAAIGLQRPKTNHNVGSVIRALQVYDGAMLAVAGKRYKRSPTDCMKGYRSKPLLQVSDLKEACPYDCIPVAVEIIEGAKSLVDYKHPERAFYIFGPEDGTLGKEVLDWCRDVVYIPTERCMNLAATVNVVLYDRMSKE